MPPRLIISILSVTDQYIQTQVLSNNRIQKRLVGLSSKKSAIIADYRITLLNLINCLQWHILPSGDLRHCKHSCI